jgi:hypothetical protein
VLVLFMGAEAVERRLLRWRYRGADQDAGRQLNHSL